MLFLRGDRTGALGRADEVRLPRTDSEPSLVFHRYGNQYFLREIRWEGTARLDLPETKAERDAAETVAKAQIEAARDTATARMNLGKLEIAAVRELADRLTAELADARRPWLLKLLVALRGR